MTSHFSVAVHAPADSEDDDVWTLISTGNESGVARGPRISWSCIFNLGRTYNLLICNKGSRALQEARHTPHETANI